MDSGFEDSHVNLDDDMDIRFSYSVSSDGGESDEPNDVVDASVSHDVANEDVSHDELENIADLTADEISNMEFCSEENAYKFYFAYAKCHGFVIRRDDLGRDKNNRMVWRQFLCNRARLRDRKYLMKHDRKRDHKPLTRTKCNARLRVRLDYSTSKWKVVAFDPAHNHALTPSKLVPCISTYRGLNDADKAQVEVLHSHGVRPCQILGYMLAQKGGYVVMDGDFAMREAIKSVFPNASHRLCAWHLQKNACENVKKRFFLEDFQKAMYANITPEEFEQYWEEVVAKHGLEGNRWVSKTYENKYMWVTAYLRDKFFARIRTTSQCEGVHSFIKAYIRSKDSIIEFLHNFEHCLREYRYNEMISDFKSFYFEPVLTTSLHKIEREASKIFTLDIFKEVRIEIEKAGAMNVIERVECGEIVKFNMNKYGQPNRQRPVLYDKVNSKFSCDCMLFESCGIPCSHIICSMRLEHMQSTPKSLVCTRWTKDAKGAYISSLPAEEMDNDMMTVARFGFLSALCNKLCDIGSKKRELFNTVRIEILKLIDNFQKQGYSVTEHNVSENDVGDPNVVRTKGAPTKKNRRRKARKCSNCSKTGHMVRTCPRIVANDDDLSMHNGSSGSESEGIIREEESLDKGVSSDEKDVQNIEQERQITGSNEYKRQVKHSGCSNMKEKRVKNLTQKTTNDCNLDKMRCNEGFRVQGSNHVPHSVGSNQNKRKMAFTDEIDNNEKIVKSSMKNLKEDCKKKVAFIDEIDNNEKIVNSSMQNSREDYKKKVAITDEIDNNKKTVMQNSREDCEMKPVVSGSMGNEEIREGVVVLPPQHSTTPGLGRMPPYFGVVPWYLHYPQAPFPSQFGQNFNGVPNLNSDRNLSHLLQQFINNGSGTGGKPDHPQ
ncbi:Zinc finger, CCHC-type [Sesbania bispinosa]|nr:Zinc finger, CCHC-type [Sesbania bispinosa]